MKEFLVTITSTVEVEVQVEATNEEEAQAKAFEWKNDYPEGQFDNRGYWDSDNELVDEEYEIYYRVVDCFNENLQVEELEDDGARSEQRAIPQITRGMAE